MTDIWEFITIQLVQQILLYSASISYLMGTLLFKCVHHQFFVYFRREFSYFMNSGLNDLNYIIIAQVISTFRISFYFTWKIVVFAFFIYFFSHKLINGRLLLFLTLPNFFLPIGFLKDPWFELQLRRWLGEYLLQSLFVSTEKWFVQLIESRERTLIWKIVGTICLVSAL